MTCQAGTAIDAYGGEPISDGCCYPSMVTTRMRSIVSVLVPVRPELRRWWPGGLVGKRASEEGRDCKNVGCSSRGSGGQKARTGLSDSGPLILSQPPGRQGRFEVQISPRPDAQKAVATWTRRAGFGATTFHHSTAVQGFPAPSLSVALCCPAAQPSKLPDSPTRVSIENNGSVRGRSPEGSPLIITRRGGTCLFFPTTNSSVTCTL